MPKKADPFKHRTFKRCKCDVILLCSLRDGDMLTFLTSSKVNALVGWVFFTRLTISIE